jgi:hypothetical protein
MTLFVSCPAASPHLGDFVTPSRRRLLPTTGLWVADNEAFSHFDPDRFRRMLDAFARAATKPVFVTAPDVVCDHHATADRWVEWCREFHTRNLPRAFALQNGIEGMPPEHALPWGNLEAIFIGGDTAFKFCPWVRECVRLAKRLGKWVHMGRVNSVRRLNYARLIGCDSCDGSGMARFRERVLSPMLRELPQQQLALYRA